MLGEDGEELSGLQIYMVGIKGTGMAALAELLHGDGVQLSGSDVADTFFTEEILKKHGIPFLEGFEASNVPKDTDLVIHSAAYDIHTHPELLEAARLGIPAVNYTKALGLYSRHFHSSGIAGVHGKTTTTAMVGVLLRAMGFPFRLLTGSVVPDFDNSATLNLGGDFLIAETCEYRRHFLEFAPENILLTSVEEDHQDYYPDLESIKQAFMEYLQLLPAGGTLVYCYENLNARALADSFAGIRSDVELVPYGPQAPGPFGMVSFKTESGKTQFQMKGIESPLSLTIPGRHNAVNACGAFALASILVKKKTGKQPNPEAITRALVALENFRSTKRRSEIVGEKDGITILDDYGHHPTAIQTTLQGLKDFYAGRRLIVSFMSHTYSRTHALLDAFAGCFGSADIVVLHKIYASAREKDTSGISGKTLYEAACKNHSGVVYFEEPLDALGFLRKELKPGDVFVTMGAGDNWKLGKAFLEETS